MSDFCFDKIAVIRNAYKEKFGIPRQSGISENVESIIEFVPPYTSEDYFRELEGFSHIWIIFVFHKHLGKDIKATVRPPRLGGNQRIGVYASRSPFRPNPIGMSVVKLNKVSKDNKSIKLHVSGADLLDGTPVLDIKPYIKYADSIRNAESAYAETKPESKLEVLFSEQSLIFLDEIVNQYSDLKIIISETISFDPRPAYVQNSEKVYGLILFDFNIKWVVNNNVAEVILIENL